VDSSLEALEAMKVKCRGNLTQTNTNDKQWLEWL